jgi:hypothetical protein
MKGTMRCGGMPGLLASTSLTPSFSSAWENREFEFFSSVSVATYGKAEQSVSAQRCGCDVDFFFIQQQI